MHKKGNISLVVLSFLFVMFILFFSLKSGNLTNGTNTGNDGLLGTTGYVVNDPTNFTLNKISLHKIAITSDGFDITFNATSFQKDDYLGCLFEYKLSQDNTANLSVGFYSSSGSIENPNVIYTDILNNKPENAAYNSTMGLVYYQVKEFKPEQWNCFALWDNRTVDSNKMEMRSSSPVLIKKIPPAAIDINGTYLGNTSLNLQDYFSDPEGDKLIYGAVGQQHVEVSINSKGEVTFLNSDGWEGYETIIFRAYDGYTGKFSDNVSIKVGSGITKAVIGCNPIWDCNWDSCVNGKQNCVYSDKANCGIERGKPINLIRDCSVTQEDTKTSTKVIIGDLNSMKVDLPSADSTKNNLLIIGLIVLIVFVIGFGAYFIFSLRKKSAIVNATSTKVNTAQVQGNVNTVQVNQPNTVNTGDIKVYIITALKQGQPEQNIVQNLLNSGWKKEDINSGLNYAKLKLFVDKNLAMGFGKEKIIEGLKAKGWKEDVINTLFEK